MKISSQNIQILLIEDSETCAMLIQSILSEHGFHNLHVSKTAETAFRLLKKTTIHLILLDIVMPRVDGFTFLKKLRQNDKLKNTPVVIVSAYHTPENIEKAKKLGVKRFIKKPIDVEKIFQPVVEVLNEKYEIV